MKLELEYKLDKNHVSGAYKSAPFAACGCDGLIDKLEVVSIVMSGLLFARFRIVDYKRIKIYLQLHGLGKHINIR